MDWQDSFQAMNINDNPIMDISGQRLDFQHRTDLDNDMKQTTYLPLESPVQLRYRDSISSTGSSTLSRNSTLSSADARYFNSVGSPEFSPLHSPSWNSNQPTPLSISSVGAERTLPPTSHTPFLNQIIEPNGLFVPCEPLPFIQKHEITKHHYVVPTFAMAGESQAEVMRLIFNQTDDQAFRPKEEYERTIPWYIDNNSSLVTLSQYTCLGNDNPVSKSYLGSLGQRLGITTILVIVSIEAFETVYPLLDNLMNAIESNSHGNGSMKSEPSWWSRVVLVVNQQHGVNDKTAFNQRKHILLNEMPRIQKKYQLSQPFSLLFLSTQVYGQIVDTPNGIHYKACCQRILWQMMEQHTISGRWCGEHSTSRMNSSASNHSQVNILNEDDESSSSSDDAIFKTVVEYVDGKKKKASKSKNKNPIMTESPKEEMDQSSLTGSRSLQRRATRRRVQKLHCHDGDDGSDIPLPTKRNI